MWRDDSLNRLSECGDVDLAPIELDEFDDDEEIRQLARNSIYTWEFTNRSERAESCTQPERSLLAEDSHSEIGRAQLVALVN